jgi:DNA-binding GntR family transcriptional regulator
MYTMNEEEKSNPQSKASHRASEQTTLPPGATHASLRDVITNAIRQAILSGRYLPGERLVEDRLAADFAVSRNPIRDSLRVLESEGLINIAPRRGATVAQLSKEEMLEIIELRAALEGLSARMACRRCTDEAREAIKSMLIKGSQAIADKDDAELGRVNDGFHDLLARAGRNRFLADFMRSLRDRTYWLHGSTQTWRARQSWEEHATILQAIAEGDEDLAAVLSSRHVTRAGLSQMGGEISPDDGEAAANAIPIVDLVSERGQFNLNGYKNG